MSKYPYIGKTSDGTVALFSSKKTGARITGEVPTLFEYSNYWNENAFADVGYHYLANSYGKCESQEHADFICKLAENSDFNICSDYSYSRVMRQTFFCFYSGDLYFFNESLASDEGRKLITLPLPPSKKEIPSTQVVESEQASKSDQVKNPKHYQFFYGLEAIEIIAASMTREQFYGYCLGNKLKYRLRAGEKDNLQQDIDKSNFYGELYEIHKDKCK